MRVRGRWAVRERGRERAWWERWWWRWMWSGVVGRCLRWSRWVTLASPASPPRSSVFCCCDSESPQLRKTPSSFSRPSSPKTSLQLVSYLSADPFIQLPIPRCRSEASANPINGRSQHPESGDVLRSTEQYLNVNLEYEIILKNAAM